MPDELADLIARCRGGDPQAEEILFQRHLGRLVALVRARVSKKLASRFDPDDVVQSAYRSFFGRLEKGYFTLDCDRDLWSLLATIALNKLHRQVAHHKAAKRSVDKEQPPPDNSSLFGPDRYLAADEPPPDEAAALVEEIERVMRPLQPLQRQMLELRLQNHTVEEIAAAINRSERTVRRFLESLRGDLRNRLTASPTD